MLTEVDWELIALSYIETSFRLLEALIPKLPTVTSQGPAPAFQTIRGDGTLKIDENCIPTGIHVHQIEVVAASLERQGSSFSSLDGSPPVLDFGNRHGAALGVTLKGALKLPHSYTKGEALGESRSTCFSERTSYLAARSALHMAPCRVKGDTGSCLLQLVQGVPSAFRTGVGKALGNVLTQIPCTPPTILSHKCYVYFSRSETSSPANPLKKQKGLICDKNNKTFGKYRGKYIFGSLKSAENVCNFFLLGFQDLNDLKIILFFLFMIIYIFTMSGNLLIILLVVTTYRLHYPMYYFLCNLSLSEIIFTTNIVPNMLHNLLSGDGSITVRECRTQYFFFSSSATTECFLLAIMSYDRYFAICNPLHYTSLMNFSYCAYLVIWCWLTSFFITTLTLILLSQLYYCGPNIINKYFCDHMALIELSCSDTSIVEIETFFFASAIILLPFIFIVITYVVIIHTIFKIPSLTGRKKAFSTCSSHLSVVCTYYGSLIALYVSPSQRKYLNVSTLLSLMYTIVTPLLNPVIYSLRNQELQTALIKAIRNLNLFSK
ncbi:olfactory receptor 11A1-like [Bombina bombina]|uniref:olfactory receptor 11A1-like n=1 Tax=Bombina bombina TaxID=8345 RepID=UPI00235AF54B|nr:olfactory receptor 11A1-like [Bombina bombina]